jgi:dimethylhistidine N-methyltransferase
MPTSVAEEARFIQTYIEDAAAIRSELLSGLGQQHARVSPKHLYDSLGSRLFEAITELPEYYPTRTEASIFEARAGELADAAGHGCTLIDLGAGNCAKSAKLFPVLQPSHYVAVDISVEFLRSALHCLQLQFPAIPMTGLGQDFSRRLELGAAVPRGRRLFFYPGSSLGNFTPEEALHFLRSVRRECADDGALLLGIDLVKDEATLQAAYDDALGVTAAFNLNLLRHLNALLGADFALRDWKHVACFNARESRVEMHLEARRALDVGIDTTVRHFTAGERIHTENSYKYRVEQIRALIAQAGFASPTVWTDERAWFAVCFARAGD